jgi:ketosteroid isomerase-like protein
MYSRNNFFSKQMILMLLLGCMIIISCNNTTGDKSGDARIAVDQAERDFEKMAAEKGIAEAFWYFADSNAVIKRGGDSVIHGKEGIRKFYSGDFFKTATVKWSPDFVEVSADGSLGYTFGKYTWQSKDSTGKINESKGIFHTVWKKQEDGSWKYVWD